MTKSLFQIIFLQQKYHFIQTLASQFYQLTFGKRLKIDVWQYTLYGQIKPSISTIIPRWNEEPAVIGEMQRPSLWISQNSEAMKRKQSCDSVCQGNAYTHASEIPTSQLLFHRQAVTDLISANEVTFQ